MASITRYVLTDVKILKTRWQPMQKHSSQHARASVKQSERAADIGFEIEKQGDGLYHTLWKLNVI